MPKSDLYQMLEEIRRTMNRLQAQFIEMQTVVGRMPHKYKRIPCSKCGLMFTARETLEEHEYHQHNGPEPSAWIIAENNAKEDVIA